MGRARLRWTIGALAAAVFLAAGCAEMLYPESREPANPMFPSTFTLVHPNPPEPELAPSRTISEQDCSKPIDFSSGNLRCK